MKPLPDIAQERKRVYRDVVALVQETRRHVATKPATFKAGLGRLFKLRKAVYEHLNQLQHEGLLLDAIAWLIADRIVSANASWSWHPRQTSGKGEPDLKAVLNGRTLICAEATAAAAPKGTIAERLEVALGKLLKGQRARSYYCFVRTVEMERAARDIVQTQKLKVKVKCLPFN
jgi:hypothetical protein